MVFTKRRTRIRFFHKKEKKVVLNNRVDAEFQDLLKPYNFIFKSIFYPKYIIRDNKISSIRGREKLTALVSTCAVIVFFVMRFIQMLRVKSETADPAHGTLFINYVLYSAGFLVNMKSAICDSNKHKLLYLRIQQVYKVVHKGGYKYDLFWCSFVSLAVIVASLVLTSCFYCMKGMLGHSVRELLVSLLDYNLVNAMQHVTLIRWNLNNWSARLERCYTEGGRDTDVTTPELFDTYVHLIDSYRLFFLVNRDLMLYQVTHIFGHSLIFVSFGISFIGKKDIVKDFSELSVRYFFPYYVWFLKIGYLLVSLCAAVEHCAAAARHSHALVLRLLSARTHTAESRRALKNMSRVLRTRWTTHGTVLHVGGTLPPALAHLTTTYVVVLLQFALQKK